MLSRVQIFLALAGLAIKALLAMPAMADNIPIFDGVYGLENIQVIGVDDEQGKLHIASSNHFYTLSTFPLTFDHSRRLDIQGFDLKVLEDNRVAVVGDLTSGARQGAASVQVLHDIEPQISEVIFAGTRNGSSASALDFLPFTSVSTVNDDLYVTTQILPHVWIYPIPGSLDNSNDDTFDVPSIRLSCGASTQISVFDFFGDVYFASSTDRGTLEFGQIDDDNKLTRSNCFSSFSRNTVSVNQLPKPLSHRIISPNDGNKSLVVLNPNTGEFHVATLQNGPSGLFVPYQGTAKYSVTSNGDKYDLLTATQDGRSIFIAHSSKNRVVHFSREENGEYKRSGEISLEANVLNLNVGKDGGVLAVVIGSNRPGSIQEVVLIKDPVLLRDKIRAPRRRYSVENVQKILNSKIDRGKEISVDGVFGEQTEAAIYDLRVKLNKVQTDYTPEPIVRTELERFPNEIVAKTSAPNFSQYLNKIRGVYPNLKVEF